MNSTALIVILVGIGILYLAASGRLDNVVKSITG